ncbi:MAG: SDR family NAD(P)-dependent oxidoreductase, partial [Candidatus Magnetobacterium sp. LHC-1]
MHPLLGKKTSSPKNIWEGILNNQLTPYLRDHVVDGNVVFPGAGYVEIGLAIDRVLNENNVTVIEDIKIHKALFIDDKDETLVNTEYNPKDGMFSVFSSNDDRKTWECNATGKIIKGNTDTVFNDINIPDVIKRCSEILSNTQMYEKLDSFNLKYGSSFQSVRKVWCNSNEILSQLELPMSLSGDFDKYIMHPIMLDAAFQSGIAILDKAYVPVSIERVTFIQALKLRLFCYARITGRDDMSFTGDITICDSRGKVYAELRSVRFKAIPKAGDRKEYLNWLYRYIWEKADDSIFKNDITYNGNYLLLFAKSNDIFCLYLQETLKHKGIKTILVDNTHDVDQEAINTLFSTIDISRVQGIIYVCSTDEPKSNLDETGTGDCIQLLYLVQTLNNLKISNKFNFYIITRVSQKTSNEELVSGYEQSSLWGFGRVVMSEHPTLGCKLIDTDNTQESITLLTTIMTSDSGEDEIAIRRGGVFVHRLTNLRYEAIDNGVRATHRANDNIPFALEIKQTGMMDSMVFKEIKRVRPNKNEVEVRVHTVALNFKDIMKVMGMLSDLVLEDTYFGNTLGMECSATIVDIGDGVTNFEIGDEVIVVSNKGCFQSHITLSLDEAYIIRKPRNISMKDASFLVPYFTVLYALCDIGRLNKGEKILIHTASGGVGIAAVNYAHSVGAEVFATAGSQNKQDYVRSLGVKYISNSRTLKFADEIKEWTHGYGVDVVLNSLPGEMIDKGIAVTAPFGRFIELGKRDIDENNSINMRPFNRNLTFTSIDVDRLLALKRELSYEIMNRVCRGIEDGSLAILPTTAYPATDIVEAFRFMSQGRHIGKVSVTLEGQELEVEALKEGRELFQPEGTYLITGGLSGYGLEVARWMADRGARNIVLVGRRGIETPGAREAVDRMTQSGVNVLVESVDVADEHSLRKMLSAITSLKGIIHCAMVLDDAYLMQIDKERFKRVMLPKAVGALNLHKLTKSTDLDFFVMFSSISSLIGNPGQGNYASANAFLDGLALYRVSAGLPALTINWGAL